MKSYFWGAGVAILIILLSALKYFWSDNIDLTVDNKVLEKTNEAKTKEVNAYTARPRTNSDVVEQLCQWANTIDSHNKSKSKQSIRQTSCP